MKLFKKTNSRFHWYDFTLRGRRYRGSTQETKSVRALQAASLKLASAMENTDPLPNKPTAYHPGMAEYTGFVDFDGFIFMCVLFAPDALAAKNLSKLRFVMRKVFPLKVTYKDSTGTASCGS